MERERKPRVFKIAEGAVRELEKLVALLAGEEEEDCVDDPEDVMARVITNLRRRNPEFNEEYRSKHVELCARLVSGKRKVQQLRNVVDRAGQVYLKRKFYQPERLVSVNPTLFKDNEGPFAFDLEPGTEYYIGCRVCGVGSVDELGRRFVEVRLLNRDGTATDWRTTVSVDELFFKPEGGLKVVDFCGDLHTDFVNSMQWQTAYDKVERLKERRENRRRWRARTNQL